MIKRGTRERKDDSKYLRHIFTVIERKFSMITVENERGKRYTRNSIFFKLIKYDDNQLKSESNISKPVKRKNYPKRHRK